MITQEILDRMKTMDRNEKDALQERIIAAVAGMEDVLANAPTAAAIVREAESTAEGIMRNFQEQLLRHEEANFALHKENEALKKQIGDVRHLKETMADMNDQIEKMRRDCEQALKERDAAKAEARKLQELWNRMHAGE